MKVLVHILLKESSGKSSKVANSSTRSSGLVTRAARIVGSQSPISLNSWFRSMRPNRRKSTRRRCRDRQRKSWSHTTPRTPIPSLKSRNTSGKMDSWCSRWWKKGRGPRRGVRRWGSTVSYWGTTMSNWPRRRASTDHCCTVYYS